MMNRNIKSEWLWLMIKSMITINKNELLRWVKNWRCMILMVLMGLMHDFDGCMMMHGFSLFRQLQLWTVFAGTVVYNYQFTVFKDGLGSYVI